MAGAASSALTLGDIVRLQAAQHPSKVALEFEGRGVSYGALEERTNRVARGLAALGIAPEDRVCYLGHNTLCYFELLLGASKLGAVTVPLNWRLATPELCAIFEDTQAHVIFVSDGLAARAQEVRAHLGDSRVTLIETSHYEDWLALHDGGEFTSDAPGADHAVLQLYTSGTTGRAKGACLSNRALLAARARDASADSPDWNRWYASDVSLIAMPCFHVAGTSFALNTLYAGATGVIVQHFRAEQQVELMLAHGITKHFVVPSALRMVLEEARARQLTFPALKFIAYGASPIPFDLMQECIDVFGCGFVQKYGMTETSGTCVALGPEDHTLPANPRMKSVGKPLAGVEVRIVDTNGAWLAPKCSGEIVVRSPSNMTGYWRDDRATRDAYLLGGWLRSGDIGYLDEDGYLFVQDRLKDMIVSGGENVYCAEVEAALRENPAVADVAVIGVPDATWGEAVKAFVVLNDDHTADVRGILAHCRERLAGYKTPKSVDFLDVLPRNAAGKILKHTLRAPYWVGHERAVN